MCIITLSLVLFKHDAQSFSLPRRPILRHPALQPHPHVLTPNRPRLRNRGGLKPRFDSNRPVRQLQRFHALELAQVVRYQRQALAACVSCDVQVIDTDRLAT